MVSDNRNQDHHSYIEKMQRYVEALEVERRKIQVFQRELPLCLELVTQAIEGCKQQLSGTTTEYFHGGQSECSEQTSSECPVLVQQFIPMKRTSSSNADEGEDGDEEHQSDDIEEDRKDSDNPQNNNEKPVKKSDWLRSVQLWNQTPDLPTKLNSPKRVPVTEVKKSGAGAFQPFKKDKSVDHPTTICELSPSPVPPTAAASSTAESGGCSGGGVGGDCKKQEKEEGQSQRKSRRCWSPELHRRFLDALQQLGGSHVATPKQIRELMKVDGLTNDEVKSHLQKFRLHTRRPNHSVHSSNNNQQAPQFVVVEGIWVPPPEYTAAAATTTASIGAAATNGIYTPIAAHPPQPPLLQIAPSQPKTQQNKQSKQLHYEERASRCEGGVHNHSPATSTSTHTSTASPTF